MGRKPIGKEKKRRVNLMLEPETYKYLQKVGDGNASAGIGLIVLRHMAQTLHDAVVMKPAKCVHCGKTAKWVVDVFGGDKWELCGTHVRPWQRNQPGNAKPIISLKQAA